MIDTSCVESQLRARHARHAHNNPNNSTSTMCLSVHGFSVQVRSNSPTESECSPVSGGSAPVPRVSALTLALAKARSNSSDSNSASSCHTHSRVAPRPKKQQILQCRQSYAAEFSPAPCKSSVVCETRRCSRVSSNSSQIDFEYVSALPRRSAPIAIPGAREESGYTRTQLFNLMEKMNRRPLCPPHHAQ